MRLKRTLFLLIVALATATAAIAQDHAKTIDDLVKQYQEYGQFNGAVLVAENGKVILKKGYGMANMEWDIPVKSDTKFRIGSVTKQFTAAIIMQLVDEGKVKLDGKLTDYLPDYRKETGDKVTVHHLLNHTSGIPSYTSLPGFFANDSRDPYTVDEFVKKFCSGDLEFEPGTKITYNNSGYFLLGAIIEKVTGKSYAENLKQRITDPLGMANTGYDTSSPLIKNRAQGYQKTADGYINAPYLDMSLPYAAGSMYSTVEDLYKWDQALYGDTLMSAESKMKMFTPGLENYGYGLVIQDRPVGKTEKKIKFIQHGGGINGFNSLFTRLVDDKHLIVILDNVGQGRYHGPLTVAIGNILYGQPFERPKLSIADTLFKTYKDKDVAAAIKKYRELKAGSPDKYDFRENELNTLGYQILRTGKTKDAIEIFKLNVEMFPGASNPYDSLGEAYLADGQKELSLKNYKKSLELDPGNGGAKAVIARLEAPEMKVDPASYDALVGEYQLAPSFVFTVTKEGDKLMGQATGQPKIELEPVSELVYVITIANAEIKFEKDAEGKVTGLVLKQGGQTLKGIRLD